MLKIALLITSFLILSYQEFKLEYSKSLNVTHPEDNLTLKDIYAIFRDSINNMTEVLIDEEKEATNFDFQKFKPIKLKKAKKTILVGFKKHQIVSIDNKKIGDCDKFSLYFHHFDKIILFTVSPSDNANFHADFNGFFVIIKSLNKYLFFDIGMNHKNKDFIKKTDWTSIKSISLLDYNLKLLKKIGIKEQFVIYRSSTFHSNPIKEQFVICNKDCNNDSFDNFNISEKNLKEVVELIDSKTFCKCGEEKILTPEISNHRCYLSLFTQFIYEESPSFPNILYKKED